MAKKQRSISRPTPTPSPSPDHVNNAEENGTDAYYVQPISKTPSISSHDSNPNSKSKKRPNENNNGLLSPKQTNNEGSDSGVVHAKNRFQRFWSLDDEITILKGMVDFISKNGSDPYKSVNDFHNFIKKSLQVEASTVQLREKIRKLKMKFEKNGNTPFPSSHDSELFELSKKIWGSAEGESDENKEEENVKVVDLEKDAEIENGNKEGENVKVADLEKDAEIEYDEEENETMLYLTKVFELYGLDNDVITKGMEQLEESKRMELEKLWKEVRMTELELSVRRVELVAKHARFILEAFKSSNH